MAPGIHHEVDEYERAASRARAGLVPSNITTFTAETLAPLLAPLAPVVITTRDTVYTGEVTALHRDYLRMETQPRHGRLVTFVDIESIDFAPIGTAFGVVTL